MPKAEQGVLKAAASVVPYRQHLGQLEVLLLQRNPKLKFYGGAWVFPGGSIDSEDIPGGQDAFSEAAARHAACREAQEEASLELEPQVLHALSHWTTPVGLPKRFATWFFLSEAADQEVVVDQGEIHDHRWLTPAEVLAQHATGDMTIAPPAFVTLGWLQSFADVRALEKALPSAPKSYRPKLVQHQGKTYSLYEEDAGYVLGDPNIPGSRHRLLISERPFKLYESG